MSITNRTMHNIESYSVPYGNTTISWIMDYYNAQYYEVTTHTKINTTLTTKIKKIFNIIMTDYDTSIIWNCNYQPYQQTITRTKILLIDKIKNITRIILNKFGG